MKRMKKTLALALSAVMLLVAMTGCQSNDKPNSGSSSGNGANTSGTATPSLDYPEQNINVIVQYSAGGGTDLSVRGVLDGVTDVPVNFSVSNVTGNGGLSPSWRWPWPTT